MKKVFALNHLECTAQHCCNAVIEVEENKKFCFEAFPWFSPFIYKVLVGLPTKKHNPVYGQ